MSAHPHPLIIDADKAGPSYKIRVEIEQTRRYAETIEVFGADSESAAIEAAETFGLSYDLLDILGSDCETDVCAQMAHPHAKVDTKINTDGHVVMVVQRIPPQDCHYAFEGATWATTGQLAIRVDAYQAGVPATDMGSWRAINDVASINDGMRSILSSAQDYACATHRAANYKAELVRALVGPDDRLQVNERSVLIVLRAGDVVAMLMPTHRDGTHLDDILASIAKALVTA